MPISQIILKALQDNDPSLQKLDLSDRWLTKEDIETLCGVLKNNTHLKSLNLARNQIGVEGAILLSKITTLTDLNLSENEIKDMGFSVFSTNKTLKKLNVAQNKITSVGVSLSEWAKNTTLIDLNLEDNTIQDDGVAVFSGISLKKLNVSNNSITETGALFLSKNTTIVDLDVSCNKIKKEGAEALSLNTTIERLDISFSYIGTSGAQALLIKNKTIIELNLEGNRVHSDGVKKIENPNIKILNVNGNKLGLEGAKMLSASTSIIDLNIGSNDIGNDGISAFSNNTSIKRLGACSNKITGKGLKLVLDNNKTITSLDVSWNSIEDADVLEFSKNTTIKTLYINANNITIAGFKSLLTSKTITVLDVSSNKIVDGDKELAEFFSKNTSLKSLAINNSVIGIGFITALITSPTITNVEWCSNFNCASDAMKLLATSKTIKNLKIKECVSVSAQVLLSSSKIKTLSVVGEVDFFHADIFEEIKSNTTLTALNGKLRGDNIYSLFEQLDSNCLTKMRARRSFPLFFLNFLKVSESKKFPVELVYKILSYLDPADLDVSPQHYMIMLQLLWINYGAWNKIEKPTVKERTEKQDPHFSFFKVITASPEIVQKGINLVNFHFPIPKQDPVVMKRI